MNITVRQFVDHMLLEPNKFLDKEEPCIMIFSETGLCIPYAEASDELKDKALVSVSPHAMLQADLSPFVALNLFTY